MSEVRAHGGGLRSFDNRHSGVGRSCQDAGTKEKGRQEEDAKVRGDSHVGGVLIPDYPQF